MYLSVLLLYDTNDFLNGQILPDVVLFYDNNLW